GETRLCLVDDLKDFKESHSRQDEEEAQDLKSMINKSIHKIEVYELMTKDKAFYTSAGNPVKEILLKLNLPDHRILKGVGRYLIPADHNVSLTKLAPYDRQT
ncbi:hypothetical protein Tco_1416837, partial [Tanacetum coccineum]